MHRLLILISLLIPVLLSCKKSPDAGAIDMPLPAVQKITPLKGQSGDTIRIEGINFSLRQGKNELSINGVPATVISSAQNQITAIIPAFCQTGNILLTVNDISVKGPVITIIPSPNLRSIFPDYGYAGDTLSITGAHFALKKEDNQVELNGIKIPVVKQQGDTLLKIIIPAGDGSGKLLFNTYNGQKKEYPKKFGLRKTYTGNLMESIRQDPGFSYINAIMERMKEIYPDRYEKIYSIWTNNASHTLFLHDNDNLRKTNKKFTSVEYVRQNADPQIYYYLFLMQATAGLWYENQLATGTYPSLLSEEESWGGPGSGGDPNAFSPIFILHLPDGLYMRLSEDNDPIRILKSNLKATNGIIHQLGN